jgi:hypothetical protein
MKDDAVEVRLLVLFAGLRVRPFNRALGQAREVGDGLGRLVLEELNGENSRAWSQSARM